jgi:hypothetical protein
VFLRRGAGTLSTRSVVRIRTLLGTQVRAVMRTLQRGSRLLRKTAQSLVFGQQALFLLDLQVSVAPRDGKTPDETPTVVLHLRKEDLGFETSKHAC